MCGPAGTLFCTMISVFGALFCGFLAILIGNNYEYVGEWYDAGPDNKVPLDTQRSDAVSNCWTVAGIYGGLAVLSGLGSCYHSFRARRS